MDLDATIRSFASLSDMQQAIVLAQFAHELTVLTRDTYFNEEERIYPGITVRDINEQQHRVTEAIVDRLRSDPRRYPDDLLVLRCADPTDSALARSYGPVLARLIAGAGKGSE